MVFGLVGAVAYTPAVNSVSILPRLALTEMPVVEFVNNANTPQGLYLHFQQRYAPYAELPIPLEIARIPVFVPSVLTPVLDPFD